MARMVPVGRERVGGQEAKVGRAYGNQQIKS